MRTAFQQDEHMLVDAEFVASIAEINHAIAGDLAIIRKAERNPFRTCRQCANCSLGVDGKKSFDGIADNQITRLVEVQARARGPARQSLRRRLQTKTAQHPAKVRPAQGPP